MPTATLPAAPAAPASASAFQPAASIDEVIARLDQIIARSLSAGDRLCYFACLYRQVTQRVKEGIEGGRFQDGPRMERLDVIFANRYLAAEHAFRAGGTPSRSWSASFSAARSWPPLVLQHLLLGMNAHINLDLAVAAVETAPGKQLAGLSHDFHEISVLLGEMIDGVQDRIDRISPWIGLLDRIGHRTDERICTFCLDASRDVAWEAARVLNHAQGELRLGEIDRLDRAAVLLARGIRSPGRWSRLPLWIIRSREPNDERTVIDALS
ncbi:MAG TPA: DUF5995 family protein [Longimicrobium sp.]|nr:DUF5995 family protein [Longimicrobium sp.]